MLVSFLFRARIHLLPSELDCESQGFLPTPRFQNALEARILADALCTALAWGVVAVSPAVAQLLAWPLVFPRGQGIVLASFLPRIHFIKLLE